MVAAFAAMMPFSPLLPALRQGPLWLRRALRKRQLRLLLLALSAHLLATSRNPYTLGRHRFHITDIVNDADAFHHFRFGIAGLGELVARSRLPAFFNTRSGYPTDAEEAMLIVLNRLAYPSRQPDLNNGRFNRWPSEISEIWLRTCTLLQEQWADLITCFRDYFQRNGLARVCGEAMARSSGYPAAKIAFFIDGTDIYITRPGGPNVNQRAFYDGHHRAHAIKFLLLTSPCGLIICILGPFQGTMTDATAYNTLQIADMCRALFQVENAGRATGNVLLGLGDSAFPASDILLTRFADSPLLTPDQRVFNRVMASLRITIENSIGYAKRLMAKVQFFATLQVGQGQIGVESQVAFWICNCRVCLYGSQASQRFGIPPPTLAQYLQ